MSADQQQHIVEQIGKLAARLASLESQAAASPRKKAGLLDEIQMLEKTAGLSAAEIREPARDS